VGLADGERSARGRVEARSTVGAGVGHAAVRGRHHRAARGGRDREGEPERAAKRGVHGLRLHPERICSDCAVASPSASRRSSLHFHWQVRTITDANGRPVCQLCQGADAVVRRAGTASTNIQVSVGQRHSSTIAVRIPFERSRSVPR
ncbi:MAG: hypothetical protein ACK56I_33680, partial [bacterium]